jgi:hypothetical protein
MSQLGGSDKDWVWIRVSLPPYTGSPAEVVDVLEVVGAADVVIVVDIFVGVDVVTDVDVDIVADVVVVFEQALSIKAATNTKLKPKYNIFLVTFPSSTFSIISVK